jgi:hypothetical protein
MTKQQLRVCAPLPEGVHAMPTRKLTRRRFLVTTAASTTLVAMPHVRGSYAAGKLSLAIWDHFVPGANATSKALIEEWATREKVEVQIDYINNIGSKLLVTVAAEAQAKTGHDILYFTSWLPSDNASNLEPLTRSAVQLRGLLYPANGHHQPGHSCPKSAKPGSRCPKKKPPEGGSQFKSGELDQAAINAGFAFRRYSPILVECSRTFTIRRSRFLSVSNLTV